MASNSNAVEENRASRAMKLMTNAMNRSISVFKNFDKQINRSTSFTKFLMDSNRQAMTINSSLNKVASAINRTVDAVEDLEQKLEGLSKMAHSIYAQPTKTNSGGSTPFLGPIQFNVASVVKESFSRPASLEEGQTVIQEQSKPVTAPITSSAISLNTGKTAIDLLKKLDSSFNKESITKMIDISLTNGLEEQQIRSILINQTGNKNEGDALFESIKNQALSTGTPIGEAAKGAMILGAFTKSTEQLNKLSELSLQISTLDSKGMGNEASAKAVTAAAQGDSSLLVKQYNIPQTAIEAFDLEGLARSGDMNAFTSALGQVLEHANMGKEAMEQMMATPVKQAQVLEQNINSAFAGAGAEPIMAMLKPLTVLNILFQAGVFQPFFDSLGSALSIAATLFTWLAYAAMGIVYIISAFWPYIEPIIWGIVTALTVLNFFTKLGSVAVAAYTTYQAIMTASTTAGTAAFALKTLVMRGAIAAWGTLNAVMKANVILIIIALIMGLIVYIIALWQKNDAFAIGFLRAWYGILNFLDRLPAYFWQLAEWILNPLIYMIKGMSDVFDTVIKGIIDDINSILGVINKVTGSKFELAASFSTDKFMDDTLNFMKIKKDDAYARAAKKAAERDQSLQAFIKDRAADDVKKGTTKDEPLIDPNKITADWSKLAGGKDLASGGGNVMSLPSQTGFQTITPNINRVGEVGKINDTVDISSEDLKTMRELAEMKNIQNFVSLQPTVSVQTGDINNGYDIDTIIGRIERSLNEEIASSAEGVYA
ncbi:hypothetical protein [Paenibacillus sp. FJAT-27812]|uniref:hypothetical protein n=1 Tax=Paenibacillus sp. FJAT-27812 TaxID=1684143 RepID=UPI0006A7C299|nr:hypothetical protein [Paenibacillus sp. FJAT-27812]